MISGSTNAGINVNGGVSGNVIQENASIGNAAGIRLNLGATGLLPTGNSFIENTIAMNTCGVTGPPATTLSRRTSWRATWRMFVSKLYTENAPLLARHADRIALENGLLSRARGTLSSVYG